MYALPDPPIENQMTYNLPKLFVWTGLASLVSLSLSAALPSTAWGQSQAGPQQPLRLQLHRLPDKKQGGMISHTVLVPSGWKVKGGAWWASVNYFNVLPSQEITVTAPNGVEVEIGPAVTAKDFTPPRNLGMPRPKEGRADGGYPIVYLPGDLKQWSEWIRTRGIPVIFPDAQNIRVSPGAAIPELSRALQRTHAQSAQDVKQRNAQNAALGTGMRNFADAGVITFESRYDRVGVQWQDISVFGVFYLGFESEMMGREIWWTLEPNLNFRGPVGKVEAMIPILMTIANSVRTTRQWGKMRIDLAISQQKIGRKVAANASLEAAKRGRILANAGREVRQINQRGYEKRQASNDRGRQKFVNAIADTEDYVVPGTQDSVQLPNNYNNVYTNGQGEYVLSNDANYNPNQDSGLNGNWQAMRARR